MKMYKYDENKLFELYKKHDGNYSRISEEIGWSFYYVSKILHSYGLKPTRSSKTTIERRRKIVEGLTISEASEILGLTKQTISANKLGTVDARFSYSNEDIISVYNNCNGNFSKMAKYWGIAQSNVSRMIKSRKLNLPSKGRNKK